MSTTEKHIGKLKKVDLLGQTPEQYLESYCIGKGYERKSYHYSFHEVVADNEDYKFFVINGVLWEAIEHKRLNECEDINLFVKNEDGTVSFITEFYNGGTCLSEMLEDYVPQC